VAQRFEQGDDLAGLAVRSEAVENPVHLRRGLAAGAGPDHGQGQGDAGRRRAEVAVLAELAEKVEAELVELGCRRHASIPGRVEELRLSHCQSRLRRGRGGRRARAAAQDCPGHHEPGKDSGVAMSDAAPGDAWILCRRLHVRSLRALQCERSPHDRAIDPMALAPF
jgi:hypothetical protein